MDKIGQAIAAANKPALVITMLDGGAVSLEFKNGIMPPAVLFAAAGMIERAANRIIDESEQAMTAQLANLDPNMGRPRT